MNLEIDGGVLTKKNIFITTPSAGASGIFVFTRVLRKKNINIDFWNLTSNKYNFPFDKKLISTHYPIINFVIRVLFFAICLIKYDVFHFYSTSYFFNKNIELLILRFFKKSIIHTFVGSEAFDIPRSIIEQGDKSPYFEYAKGKSKRFFINRKKRIDFIIKHSNKIVLNGPWLIDSVKKFDAIIPYPRYIPEEIPNTKIKKNKLSKLTILHAPTDKSIKGTNYIIRAIHDLQIKGLSIKLLLPPPISHDKLQELIQQSDIIIDQLLIGWYGGFAVEAMAQSKPVIAYLQEAYRSAVSFSNSIPIINANINTLKKTLEYYYYNRDELQKITKRCREFVLRVHSPQVIASQYLQIYNQAITIK